MARAFLVLLENFAHNDFILKNLNREITSVWQFLSVYLIFYYTIINHYYTYFK